MRPLWLDSEAVHAAELCAEAAGGPVARFIDSMLFELCGTPPPVRSTARVLHKRRGQVIRIDRRARP